MPTATNTLSNAAPSFWTSGFLGPFLIALAVAAVIAAVTWLLRGWWLPSVRTRLAERRARRAAVVDVVQLAAYLTHVRDFVMPMIWRAHEKPADVREHIRRDILEPIRGYVPTEAGEHLKVVWFRPNDDGTELIMYEQVGHTPEGQKHLALPIGAGTAGRAFTKGETVYDDDIETSEIFHPVERGVGDGSIACVPIQRGNEVKGVLSVLSSSKSAFRYPELLYFQALASAIGAIEILEKDAAE